MGLVNSGWQKMTEQSRGVHRHCQSSYSQANKDILN